MLFKYRFKRCKYCNKYFIPQHNRQVHCNKKHQKLFYRENEVNKRFKQRKKEQHIGYIDNHGEYVTGKPNKLQQLGSLGATLTSHRHHDTTKEREVVSNELKRIGLRC